MFKNCIAVILLFLASLSANAYEPHDYTLSVFGSDMETPGGAMLGVKFGSGDVVMVKGDVILSESLGGVSLGIGRSILGFDAYIGLNSIMRTEDKGHFVDVAGVNVFDPTGDPDGNGAFIEINRGPFFVRYTRYRIEYDWFATRSNPGPGPDLAGLDSLDEDLSTWWAGFNIPIK